MSVPSRPKARLLFRVDPLRDESPRGYLCRVASAHGYCSPSYLIQIAGLSPSGLEREEGIEQIARVLRHAPEEWRAMCYRHIRGQDRFNQRSFCGERLNADDLNYGRPRICSACLQEQPIWWAVWDLGLVTACPIHFCLLVEQCPACKRRLTWYRPAVHECRCGLDFRTLTPEAANPDLVAINAAIYRAARFATGETPERHLAQYGFPPQMLELKLGSLLGLVRFLGSIWEKGGLRRKQLPFRRTNLTAAIEIGCAAVTVLRDWPQPLCELLRRMVPEEVDPAALNFSEIFGNFYRHLFCVLSRSEFGFLRNVFDRFVIEDWKGLIRGQHRYSSPAVRRNSQWIPADEAEKTARVCSKRIVELVRQRHIEGMLLASPGGHRTECWVRRQSLNRWIAKRDLDLGSYMPSLEARRTLGLKHITILRVAQAGLVRYVHGSDRCFPTGYHFLREDVMKIKGAFEKYSVPEREYSKPSALVALRHALKNYLGRDSGLPAVIRAVVDGNLVPVGYTRRFSGITGYLFLSQDIRKYRPVGDSKVPPQGFLNYREAAALLGVRTSVIRGLVAQGSLSAPVGYQPGLSKLIPAADVQSFADRYVAASTLAKQLNLNRRTLRSYIKECAAPLFAVPIPEEGRGPVLFVQRVSSGEGWR